jgi:hypothetical protein
MARNLLKFKVLSFALFLAVCSLRSGWAAAAHAPSPRAANPHHQTQNIILFQAKIATECAGKCSVEVQPESTSSSSNARLQQSPSPPLEALLRPWNTLTLASDEDNLEYKAKITCSNKCQATTGHSSFPLWTPPNSSLPEENSKKQQLATTLHTSHNSTNVYISTLKNQNTDKEHDQLSPAVVIVHTPSNQAVCRARKGNTASLLKFSSLIIWVAGCPVAAWIASNYILSKP